MPEMPHSPGRSDRSLSWGGVGEVESLSPAGPACPQPQRPAPPALSLFTAGPAWGLGTDSLPCTQV